MFISQLNLSYLYDRGRIKAIILFLHYKIIDKLHLASSEAFYKPTELSVFRAGFLIAVWLIFTFVKKWNALNYISLYLNMGGSFAMDQWVWGEKSVIDWI